MNQSLIQTSFSGNNKKLLPSFAMVMIAVIITSLIAYFMYSLIHTNGTELTDNKKNYSINFVRVKHKEIIKREPPKPTRPPQPQTPPPEPPMPKMTTSTPKVSKMDVAPTNVKTNIALSAEGFSVGAADSDNDFLPIAKVSPIYPRYAARRGIEGSCTVRYTVMADGSVSGVTVVKGKCSNSAFITPSIQAAKQFHYKPRVTNGFKVNVPNVENRFTYQLEKHR